MDGRNEERGMGPWMFCIMHTLERNKKPCGNSRGERKALLFFYFGFDPRVKKELVPFDINLLISIFLFMKRRLVD